MVLLLHGWEGKVDSDVFLHYLFISGSSKGRIFNEGNFKYIIMVVYYHKDYGNSYMPLSPI